eukprot:1159409-Pelagomonas_calceolata.AAC.4
MVGQAKHLMVGCNIWQQDRFAAMSRNSQRVLENALDVTLLPFLSCVQSTVRIHTASDWVPECTCPD